MSSEEQEYELSKRGENRSSAYYPILLDLNGKSCVVVGGGRVAERKIIALLEANARVTVISPEVTPIISDWIATGKLEGIREGYASQYSSEAYLVIAATDSTEVNACVYADSAARGQLINRVDCPEQSNFIVPAVVRRGKLSIAISTAGASPSLAAEIRQKLEQEYGEEYELYLDFLGELRLLVQEQVLEAQERKRILKAVLELDVLASIREGSFNKQQFIEKLLGDIRI